MLVLRSVRQTSSVSPSQWEGETVDGRPAYVRYRHGQLTVRIAPAGASVDDAIRSIPIFDEQCGEKHGCILDWEEVAAFTGLRMMAG